MYKTYKNIVDVQLDFLETLIYSISDKDEQKKAIIERVKLYREELNNNNCSLTELNYQVRHLTVNLSLYLSGAKVDVLEDLAPIPELKSTSEEIQNPSQQIDLKNISHLLSQAVHTIDSLEDSTQKTSALFVFEQTYMEISKINNQEIEQHFSKIKYELMKELLIKGELSKAKLLTHTFNDDVRLYITKRLYEQREDLVSQGKYKEAYEILDYISTEKVDINTAGAPERSLQFWEKIIRIENPELNYTLPKVQIRKIDKGFKGIWKAVRSFIASRKGNDKLNQEQIREEDKEIDIKGEQGDNLTSLLSKIRELRQKILYFELGLNTISPKKREKHI